MPHASPQQNALKKRKIWYALYMPVTTNVNSSAYDNTRNSILDILIQTCKIMRPFAFCPV